MKQKNNTEKRKVTNQKRNKEQMKKESKNITTCTIDFRAIDKAVSIINRSKEIKKLQKFDVTNNNLLSYK